MRTESADSGKYVKGDPSRFSGEVWLRYSLSDEQGTTLAEVHFSPSARTHWHRHPTGQFLYVLSGRGRARTKGEAGQQLSPGDVVHVTDSEWHFHGAEHEASMVHIAVSGGGTPEWGDAVTDLEYDEGF